ncbi:hypothetical protein HDV05_002983, partial [Chytridiales sp. JEL 0842]
MKSIILSFTAVLAFFSASLASAANLPFDKVDYPYGDSDVSVIKTLKASGCNQYYCDPSFVVYLAVKNKSSTKKVGIIYTQDSWASNNVVFTNYTQPLDNGFELWQLYVQRSLTAIPYPETQLAAFVEYNNDGKQIYDPRNNYFIKADNAASANLPFDKVDYPY